MTSRRREESDLGRVMASASLRVERAPTPAPLAMSVDVGVGGIAEPIAGRAAPVAPSRSPVRRLLGWLARPFRRAAMHWRNFIVADVVAQIHASRAEAVAREEALRAFVAHEFLLLRTSLDAGRIDLERRLSVDAASASDERVRTTASLLMELQAAREIIINDVSRALAPRVDGDTDER